MRVGRMDSVDGEVGELDWGGVRKMGMGYGGTTGIH